METLSPLPTDANSLSPSDIEKAKAWDLSAKFLEEKTGCSTLHSIGLLMLQNKETSPQLTGLFEWCLQTGASVSLLEQKHSGFLFEMARLDGSVKLWQLLFDSGYSKDKVTARFKDSGPRLTSKLGLLCCSPYCYNVQLGALVELLIGLGIDPNERDSDGVTPLGRVNEHLCEMEKSKTGTLVSEGSKIQLILAAEKLIVMGADPSGILPLPERYAAECIRQRISAAIEKQEIGNEISVPDVATWNTHSL